MNKNKNEDIQQFFTPKIAVLVLVMLGCHCFAYFQNTIIA